MRGLTRTTAVLVFGTALAMTAAHTAEAATPITMQQLTAGATLSDGDVITLVRSASSDVPSDKIGFKFILGDKVTWWKGFRTRGQHEKDFMCEVEEKAFICPARPLAKYINADGLQLWKAKTFGNRAHVYTIPAGVLQGGSFYTLTWLKD